MKYLRDKRDGDLWGWTVHLAENPNFEEVEVDPRPQQVEPAGSDSNEKPKRKSYKAILKEKAFQLEESKHEETGVGEAESQQEEQASDSDSKDKSQGNG